MSARAPRRLLAAILALGVCAGAAPAIAHGARPVPYVRDVPEPASLAFDARGRLWIASGGHLQKPSNGVWLARRRGERPIQVVAGLYSALGLTWHARELYVAFIVPAPGGAGHVGRVAAFSAFDGRRFRRSRVVVDGLPVGRHRLGAIVAGPRDRLYLGIGSQYDNVPSASRLAGTVVSFRPSGRGLRIEATGLRNPYGLAFVPGTSRLLVSEHGRDDLGLRRPNDELNVFDVDRRVVDFGFPACFNQGGAACRGTRPPLVLLPPHAAPGALAVRSEARGSAVAYLPQFGSSFSANPTGGDVLAIRVRRFGSRPDATARRLVKGLGLQNPLGAAIGPDGRLYVSLWTRGRIVRVALPRPARTPRVLVRGARAAGRLVAVLEALTGRGVAAQPRGGGMTRVGSSPPDPPRDAGRPSSSSPRRDRITGS